MEQVLFYPTAVLILGAAACIVCGRKPLYSSLWLLVLNSSLGLLYLSLEAELLAGMQMISALAVALVLVIIVLSAFRGNPDEPRFPRQRWQLVFGIVLSALFLGAVAFTLTGSMLPGPQAGQSIAALNAQEGGNSQAVGALLLRRYALPLEVTAVLLLTALTGALTLVKTEREGEK